MNRPDWLLISLFASIFSVVGFAVLAAIVSENNEQAFSQRCIEAGGIPSRYKTMTGKTAYQERLCIKPESVIEVAP